MTARYQERSEITLCTHSPGGGAERLHPAPDPCVVPEVLLRRIPEDGRSFWNNGIFPQIGSDQRMSRVGIFFFFPARCRVSPSGYSVRIRPSDLPLRVYCDVMCGLLMRYIATGIAAITEPYRVRLPPVSGWARTAD